MMTYLVKMIEELEKVCKIALVTYTLLTCNLDYIKSRTIDEV